MESEEQKFPKIIRLNVGGITFTTSKDTLLSDENSMLALMFSGKYNVEKDDDGRYFIDRDGTHFRYILNFLRDGSTYIPYTNKQLVDELYEEVKFYQIQELLMRLEEERNQNLACSQIDYIKLLELLNLSSKPLQAPCIKLSKMQLSYLDFSKCNLMGSDLSEVTGIEVNFRHSKLSGCVFKEANLKGCNMREVLAEKCNFQSAILSGADMRNALFKECDFTSAKMSGVDLRESVLDNSVFIEANLIVGNLERASLYGCEITGANLDRASLKGIKGLDPSMVNS
ncbi:unnamed protein product [Moneuplotes crassus]|uniref:BTB domain-containing protein n=1 Tax=Euplotes crassus TaxID=5936 RepID=A0AAD1XQC0_EUPCR|nr:unnamed protein product [Moneuplotes crassus]